MRKKVYETKVSWTVSCKTPMMGDSITQKPIKSTKPVGIRTRDLKGLNLDFQAKRS
ncbi:hypothetical protein [Methanolacinia paynteri]|uniref:hypothetical protein n=1 Tax=Methanolacinia paynteri TaxID=230356 RepID=UPI0012F702A9|nr:hypothetical protein [Methanolacinia paynteri]